MRFLFPVFVALITITFASGRDTWPQYRGPTGDGRSAGGAIPSRWSESENIRWKVAIHDRGWSSPVIWDNQIWMTTALENGKELFAVCVDRRTGKIVHDLKLYTVERPAFCHAFNSYASCTPVVEAGRVYVHFGSVGTACLDSESGRVLWQRRDLPCDHFRGPGSSPILYGNLLIVHFDGFDYQYVVALDKTTGKTVWKRDRAINFSSDDGDLHKAYSTPAVVSVAGRDQLICPAAEATIALDALTGDEVWRIIHGGMNVAARPVFTSELVFLMTGHSKQLLAVRLGSRGELARDSVAWTTFQGVPSRASALLSDGLLFLVSDTGVATCFDATTGKRHWQERLGGQFTASPIYADGLVYFPDEDGKTYVVKAASTFQLVAVNKLDAGCMASPAVVGNSLYLRTKTHLYCIGGPNQAGRR